MNRRFPPTTLSELTRQHVTVALNGDGGDENFAGYNRYQESRAACVYTRLQKRFDAELAPRHRSFPDARVSGCWRHAAIGSCAWRNPERDATRGASCNSTCRLKAEICTPEFAAATAHRDAADLILDAFRHSDATDSLEAALDVDIAHYLPDCLLVKVDIATMAHGLEGRSPLLDHEFMEFAASLPPEFKLHSGDKKYIFRRAVRHLLPPEIVDRTEDGVWSAFGALVQQRAPRNGLRHVAQPPNAGARIFSPGGHQPTPRRALAGHSCLARSVVELADA